MLITAFGCKIFVISDFKYLRQIIALAILIPPPQEPAQEPTTVVQNNNAKAW